MNFSYGKHLLKNLTVLPWTRILGFYDYHIPISYKKSIFQKVSLTESEEFANTSEHRFRTKEDINHWLVRYWQLCEGHFLPRSQKFGVYFDMGLEKVAAFKSIEKSIHKIVCLNDISDDYASQFDSLKEEYNKVFEKKYPKKSKFER
nr:stealth conserved region 3 domain-containing protein [Streptococcus sp. NLN64]